MSDLVNRLRGEYRIPITDGLGPFASLLTDGKGLALTVRDGNASITGVIEDE